MDNIKKIENQNLKRKLQVRLLGIIIVGCLAVINLWIYQKIVFAKDLKVGFLLGNSSMDRRIWNFSSDILKKIDYHMNSNNYLLFVPRRGILVGTPTFADNDSSLIENFNQLYDNGFRVFFGLDDFNIQTILDLSMEKEEKCFFVSQRSILGNSTKDEILLINFDVDILSKSFLKLINESSPIEKSSFIIPIGRQHEATEKVYNHLKLHIKEFKNLRLSQPIFYKTSQYIKSDGMEIVSRIRNQIEYHPDSVLLFLNNHELVNIAESAYFSKELRTRRWYAKDAEISRESFENNSKVIEVLKDVSLTTLAFNIDDVYTQSIPLNKHVWYFNRDLVLNYYIELTAAKDMIWLTQSYFCSNENGLASFDLDAFIGHLDKRINGSYLSIIFNDVSSNNVTSLPFTGWIPEHSMKIQRNLIQDSYSIEIEKIYVLSLNFTEILNIEALKKEKCPIDKAIVHFPTSILSFNPLYSFEELSTSTPPTAFLLPTTYGVDITLKCKEPQEKDVLKYSCLPNESDPGNFTCVTILMDKELVNKRRLPRAIEDVDSTKKKNKFLTKLETAFGDTFEVWQKLTPNIIQCAQTFMSCEFCMSVLSSFNVSAAPSSCMGGCAMGVFGTCTSMLGTSIQETFNALD